MIILDLQWVLFGLAALILLLLGASAVLLRRGGGSDAGARLGALKPLADGAPVGVLALDGARLRYVNDPGRRLLHLTSDDTVDSVWMQPLRADMTAAQEDAAHGPAVHGRARTLTRRDGSTIRWWVLPWEDLTLVFVSDISAQQQLEQAARSLISDLAHELRTPLATLLTHLEILQLPDVAEDVRTQSILFMRDETQRLVRLTNNALALGRLETSLSHSPAPVDLAGLVDHVVAQLSHDAHRKEIDLVTAVDAHLPPAWGEPDQLKQLFLNLLDNAIKYCRTGDTVTVAVALEQTGLACSVCDTGPGIAPKHRANVARRFYRGVPSGVSGSGLGLALVAEILRRHDSELQVESRSHSDDDPAATGDLTHPLDTATGTCMRFRLPIAGGRP